MGDRDRRYEDATFADIIGSESIRVSPSPDGGRREVARPPSFDDLREQIEAARAARQEMDEAIADMVDAVMSAVDECIEAGHGSVMVDQRDGSVHVFRWADLDDDGRPCIYIFNPPAGFPPLFGDDNR